MELSWCFLWCSLLSDRVANLCIQQGGMLTSTNPVCFISLLLFTKHWSSLLLWSEQKTVEVNMIDHLPFEISEGAKPSQADCQDDHDTSNQSDGWDPLLAVPLLGLSNRNKRCRRQIFYWPRGSSSFQENQVQCYTRPNKECACSCFRNFTNT